MNPRCGCLRTFSSALDEKNDSMSHPSPVACWVTLTSIHPSWNPGSFSKVASLGKDRCPHFAEEDPRAS